MFDRDAVARYDEWVREAAGSTEGAQLVARRRGLFGRVYAMPVSTEERPGCEAADVLVAGAGPWGMLLGRLLALRGHEVVVVERAAGPGSTVNWNLSRDEFTALRATGAFDREPSSSPDPTALAPAVRGDFSRGVFRIFDRPAACTRDFEWNELYNVSLEEHAFLRALAHGPGLTVRFGERARLERVTRTGAYVDCEGPAGTRSFKARLFVDARGWSSPLGRQANQGLDQGFAFDVLGLQTGADLPREHSPDGTPLGLHVATYADEEQVGCLRVQPILERFSLFLNGHRGELVNAFVGSARPEPLAPMVDALLPLVARVAPGFSEEHVVRSYFGHIPGYRTGAPWARRRVQTSAGDRTLLVGCAARQYSPLTGASIGPLARNAVAMAGEIHQALADADLSFDRLSRIDLAPGERVSQAVEGLFARIMLLEGDEPPGTVNADWLAFLQAAEGMDPKLKNAAFRDQMRLRTLHQLLGLAVKDPALVRSFVRNNDGALWTAVGVLLWAYGALLGLELREVLHGHLRHLGALFAGLGRLPLFVGRAARLHHRAAKESRRRRRSRRHTT